MLKIDIRNIKGLNSQELQNLLNLVKINKNDLLTYMELERFRHERAINDLTLIVDHGDDWARERAEVQRIEELEMSNAYFAVIKTLRPWDTRRPAFRKMSRADIRGMVNEIKKDLDKEKPQMKQAVRELDKMMDEFNQDDDVTADMVIAGIHKN